jgi:hypothetical protein
VSAPPAPVSAPAAPERLPVGAADTLRDAAGAVGRQAPVAAVTPLLDRLGTPLAPALPLIASLTSTLGPANPLLRPVFAPVLSRRAPGSVAPASPRAAAPPPVAPPGAGSVLGAARRDPGVAAPLQVTDAHAVAGPSRAPITAPAAPAEPPRTPVQPPRPGGHGGGLAVGGSGGGLLFSPFLALLVALALAAPRLLRRHRAVPAFLRPTPFVCALERPG